MYVDDRIQRRKDLVSSDRTSLFFCQPCMHRSNKMKELVFQAKVTSRNTSDLYNIFLKLSLHTIVLLCETFPSKCSETTISCILARLVLLNKNGYFTFIIRLVRKSLKLMRVLFGK